MKSFIPFGKLTKRNIEIMTITLRKRLQRSCCITVASWSHAEGLDTTVFSLHIIPGFNSEECTIYDFNSWDELVDNYKRLMKKENLK